MLFEWYKIARIGPKPLRYYSSLRIIANHPGHQYTFKNILPQLSIYIKLTIKINGKDFKI